VTNGNSASADVLRHSITRGDHEAPGAGVFQILAASAPSVPGLPAYWSFSRDFVLGSSVHMESMWGSAIGKAITKQASLGWTVADTNDSDLRTKRAQLLLHLAEGGQGWVTFLSKHLRNYLTADNGAFIEVVRATQSSGSKILGLMHLDSLRCTRTGDPEIPLLYRDRAGREHMLRSHQVLMFADMPDPSDTFNGIGLCAASRAWTAITRLTAIETYLNSKVTGERITAIYIVSGITGDQLKSAMVTADVTKQITQAAKQAGENKALAVTYKGAMVVPVMSLETAPGLVTIPLAEIPDGFDAKQERDNAYVIYANAIGIPVQDIQPLSGQGLGTGTQTIILDEAARGMGLAAWRKQFEHALNEFVLPETTTFTFSTNDIRDQKAKADVQSTRANTRKLQIESGEITAAEAKQMAVDLEDVPREFLTDDQTPGGTLQDDQKPVDASAIVPALAAAAPVAQPAVAVAPVATKAKRSFRDVAALLDEQEAAAVALYDEVTHGE
jgi:hypothetical protein